MIIHRRRPLHRTWLAIYSIIFGLFAVSVARHGGAMHWIVAGVVWAVIAAVLVRRYRMRGKRDDLPPPWVV